MHVFVLADQVDVDSDLVDDLDVDLLEAIGKSGLVNPLLHRVQVER